MADDNDNIESEDEADEQETALLPRSWFQGKDIEVGKKCELKVEGIFDDEIEVSYVPHKKKDKDGKDNGGDDSDSDDKQRRDSMDGALREMDMMAVAPPPSMGGY